MRIPSDVSADIRSPRANKALVRSAPLVRYQSGIPLTGLAVVHTGTTFRIVPGPAEEDLERGGQGALHILKGQLGRTNVDATCKPTRALLPVVASPGSLEATEIVPPTSHLPHPERDANIARLTSLVDWPGGGGTDLTATYDAMVFSVARNLIAGAAPPVGRATIAVVPQYALINGITGFSNEQLGQTAQVVCSMENDTFVVIRRNENPKRFKLLVRNGKLLARPPNGPEKSAREFNELLPDLLGTNLPAPFARMLGSMEAGGEAFADSNGKVTLVADAQAGVVLTEDGHVASFFSNHEAASVAPDRNVVFGYHSHPTPDPEILGSDQPLPNPARASGADLIAFGRRCEADNRSIPQVIWYQSGPAELTGMVFAPKKDKYGWAAPVRPDFTITCTFATA